MRLYSIVWLVQIEDWCGTHVGTCVFGRVQIKSEEATNKHYMLCPRQNFMGFNLVWRKQINSMGKIRDIFASFSLHSTIFAYFQVINALNIAEQTEKPPLIDMFTDVYDVIPPNLLRQAASLRKSVLDHPDSYPKEIVWWNHPRHRLWKGMKWHLDALILLYLK